MYVYELQSMYVCILYTCTHKDTFMCISTVWEISITPALSNTRPVTTVNLHSILYIPSAILDLKRKNKYQLKN